MFWGANHGETWADVQLNHSISLQTHAFPHIQGQLELPGWMEEMMDRAVDTDAKLVTGEWAYQAARLFTMENRRRLLREGRRVETLMNDRDVHMDYCRWVEVLEQQVGSLLDRIGVLEGREQVRREQERTARQRARRSRPSNSSDEGWGAEERLDEGPVAGLSVLPGFRMEPPPRQLRFRGHCYDFTPFPLRFSPKS